MARLIVIVPLALLLVWKLLGWWADARAKQQQKLQGQVADRRVELEERMPAEHGVAPLAELRVAPGPGAGPETDAALAAAGAGDWRPAAALLAGAAGDPARRWSLVGPLAEAAAEDDAWLTAWRAERPDSADAALVDVAALVDLAWNIRTGKLAKDVSQEQFRAFHGVLLRAEAAAKEAERLADPADPLPFVAQQPLAMGLNWDNERYRALWAEIVARDPHHFNAHARALQYWCAKWHGSHEEMHAFADAAIAAAPAGSLLTVLKLQAWDEQFRREDAPAEAYARPEVLAAASAVEADLAVADPAHPRIATARGWLAHTYAQGHRAAEAMAQFRALGRDVPEPWAGHYPDPVRVFALHRLTVAARLAAG